MKSVWSDLHKRYSQQDWVNKPSLFAQTAMQYFPKLGKILDLGAGLGQDSRYFAVNGYDVVSTDLEESVLTTAKSAITPGLAARMSFQKVDLREELPFEDAAFDVVYAHLSLHYFDFETTVKLFGQIQRVLKPGGVLAFLVNSVNDPEYKTGKQIESDYFRIEETAKRYFSTDSARQFTHQFNALLLDEEGETYKDSATGVHNLVRFIGQKSKEEA